LTQTTQTPGPSSQRRNETRLGGDSEHPGDETVFRGQPAAEPTSFANGRYEVKRFLGEGGKKRVYLAHDAQLDRDVAFALIKTEGLDDAARQRITREAQAMGRLGSHPYIVTVYDIGEENGQPYLVLPVLPGGDVEGVIKDAEDHKLSIEQAIKIATETCLGLEFRSLRHHGGHRLALPDERHLRLTDAERFPKEFTFHW
jgi:serine/threonine protein kinase